MPRRFPSSSPYSLPPIPPSARTPAFSRSAIHLCTPATAPLVARQLKEFQGLSTSPADALDYRAPLQPADILCLVGLLRWRRTGPTAQRIAYALTTLAVTNPLPELRLALPLIRPSRLNFFAPAEFLQATKAIEQATAAWADLPLPAEPEMTLGDDLPRPVDNSP